MRLTILDGFRGYFLLFMAIVHIDGIVHVTLGKINHHWLGWVEDAQGFVFISGFVVGLVYGGRYVRRSFAEARRGLLQRMWTIWTYHAALVLFILAATLVLTAFGITPNIVGPYRAEPVIFPILSLLLVSNSAFMDILPLYLWLMLATPWALWTFRTGRTPSFVVIAVGAWVLAQVGLGPYLVAALEGWLDAATGRDWILGLGFNPLGWQVIYFAGLWLGLRQAEGNLDLGWLKRPDVKAAALWALGLVAALALFDRIVQNQLISPEFSGLAWRLVSRDNFSDIYVVNFFADLFVISWLVVAGPTSDLAWARAVGRGIAWLFTRPFLVFLGQHSLQVFAWHVAVTYLIDFAVSRDTFGELGGSLVMIAGAVSIYIPAWLHARAVAARKAARDPVAGAPA